MRTCTKKETQMQLDEQIVILDFDSNQKPWSFITDTKKGNASACFLPPVSRPQAELESLLAVAEEEAFSERRKVDVGKSKWAPFADRFQMEVCGVYEQKYMG